MNPKSLIISIVVAFLVIFGTDYLIHGVWLVPAYHATSWLWRPDAEMGSHMGWLIGGQLLAAATFVLIWARGFAATATPVCGLIYGACMGAFSQVHAIISYAVSPISLGIAARWFGSGVLQAVLLGFIVSRVYRPLKDAR